MFKRIPLKMLALSLGIHCFVLSAFAWALSGEIRVELETEKKPVPIEVELGEFSPLPQNVDMLAKESSQDQSILPDMPNVSRAESRSRSRTTNAMVTSAATGITGGAEATPVSNARPDGTPASAVSSSPGVSAGRHASQTPDRRPYVISGPAPRYPEEARVNGWEGSVRVRVLVSESGLVQDASVVSGSGYASVDQAALEGLRRWRFGPAYKNGVVVSAWVVVPVMFQLRN